MTYAAKELCFETQGATQLHMTNMKNVSNMFKSPLQALMTEQFSPSILFLWPCMAM